MMMMTLMMMMMVVVVVIITDGDAGIFAPERIRPAASRSPSPPQIFATLQQGDKDWSQTPDIILMRR